MNAAVTLTTNIASKDNQNLYAKNGKASSSFRLTIHKFCLSRYTYDHNQENKRLPGMKIFL